VKNRKREKMIAVLNDIVFLILKRVENTIRKLMIISKTRSKWYLGSMKRSELRRMSSDEIEMKRTKKKI